MDFLEYPALKQKGLIHLDGAKASIDRGEVTEIDIKALDDKIAKHKLELEQLEELRHDLPLVPHVP